MNSKTWYECRVNYTKIDEKSGKDKTVTEPYLFDTVSFTDAETKASKEFTSLITGEFDINAIKRTKIEEIHGYDGDGLWFKNIVYFIDVDEQSGKEKKTRSEILINADSINQSEERLKEVLKGVIVPFEQYSISQTKIIDVFPYQESKDNEQS